MHVTVEQIPLQPGESFAAFEYPIRELDHAYHLHPEAELAVVQGVNGTVQCGAATASFRSGEFFLMGPNVPHRFIGRAPDGVRAYARVVQFKPDLLGERLLGLPEASALRDLLDRAQLGLSLPDPAPDVRDALASLLTATGMTRIARLFALFDILTSAPWSSVSDGRLLLRRDTRDATRVRALQTWLQEHFRDQVTEETVAGELGFTRTSFCRWIRSTTGRTFTEMLNDHRIAHATLLLRQTDLAVSTIALDSGYRSLSNFYREFRRRESADPTTLRAAASRSRARL